MDKKIAIITTLRAINFGAVLQSYALHKKLINDKYQVEVIDFLPKDFKNKVLWGRKQKIHTLSIKRFLYSFIYFANLIFFIKRKIKIRRFDDFIKHHIRTSSRKFSSDLDLINNINEYDIYISGSDQIWNINLFNLSSFFLIFFDRYPNATYIAYAASFAEKLDKNQFRLLSKNTTHYNFISIREASGAKEIVKYIDKDVKKVLDPVFLLNKDDWSIISESLKIDYPFILLYALSPTANLKFIIKYIREALNLPVVCIGLEPFNRYKADEYLVNVSPENFIWLFSKATFIITSSFHGTAFSIIFEKRFCCVAQKNRSSRLRDLLNDLDLHLHLVEDCDVSKINDTLQSINYELVNKTLNIQIQESNTFLKDAIQFKQ